MPAGRITWPRPRITSLRIPRRLPAALASSSIFTTSKIRWACSMPSARRSNQASTSTWEHPSRRKAKPIAILQRMANEFHDRFRRLVIEARPRLATAPPEVFDGVFTAQQAIELGMVDHRLLGSGGRHGTANGCALGSGALVLLHRPSDDADAVRRDCQRSDARWLSARKRPWDRTRRLPTFLYLWQPEPTMEKLSGK